jgi:hypothetical protein
MHDPCPRCDSNKLIPDLSLDVKVSVPEGYAPGTADVSVQGAPQAWVFKDTIYGGLTVRVCGECGHAELNARNFRQLFEKYEKSRQS